MTSPISCWLKASRSATCSPSTSVTVSVCPLPSKNAVPDRGGISCGMFGGLSRAQRTAPFAADSPAAILPGFGHGTVAGQHRVGGTGQSHIPFDDRAAHLLVHARGAQLLELVVQVEHERRAVEAPRRTAGTRMQTDHEKCFSAKAQREMRVIGIAADARVDRQAGPVVLVAQRLQPLPQMLFEAC